MNSSHFSKDIQDFLLLLKKHDVQYLIVGGEAVIYYGFARLTGDVDFYYRNEGDNILKLYKVLQEFWMGNIPGLKSIDELKEPGFIIQFGVPPNRIDLVNKIDNVEFEKAWENKKVEKINIRKKLIPIFYIGLKELIKNKQALNRFKDQEDLKYLRKVKLKL
jgi:hypothetical protein